MLCLAQLWLNQAQRDVIVGRDSSARKSSAKDVAAMYFYFWNKDAHGALSASRQLDKISVKSRKLLAYL